jgi:uncharacterized protein DUF2513
MTRDMDLVRKILLAMEAEPGGYAPQGLAIEGYDEHTIGHHCWLMNQAELIIADDVTSQGDNAPTAIPTTITWHGHEFIAATREPSIWNRALAITKRAGGATFPVLMKVLTDLALERMGLKP